MNHFQINQKLSIHAIRRPLLQILVLAISVIAVPHTYAGTIFYNAISPTDSDANSGISTANQYTSAVDGGNSGGPDRVVNGITLYALSGNGQTSAADNCTLTALSGSLTNGGGSAASIQADGTLREILSSMTFNNGVADNSQQEIVLDPASLEADTTYDLRVYICNASGQSRQVNLAFAGDGQAPVETGFFNEDDATTSAGGFTDPNQAYYINYRYTWDGESTPGITITQKSGSAPFCLYALTNQVVASGEAASPPASGGEEGLSAGYVNTESDQVGVASDDFYQSESLNKHGRWVKADKWGASWQPTNVPSGWSPYTNGSFQYCEDCGWTFVSDEPWAWATYHYGRWTRVHSGCGWAWVPGKVWAGSWVSWRQGQGNSRDSIGWAPLPPEAGCELGVGVSTWADQEYDIGPDYYTFINVRDFGSDSYLRGGFIYNRGQNVTIINQTINITNIAYNRSLTYAGGPNFFNLNQAIQRQGGRPIATVNVNRFAEVGRFQAGQFARKQGNQLALLSPRIRGGVAATHTPKFAETLGSDKIDKGWPKDPKIKNDLKNRIAEQNKGINPKTTRATLPPDVAQNLKKGHGGGQHPGAPFNQHPGGNVRDKGLGQVGGTGGAGNAKPGGPGAPFNQHPGGNVRDKGLGQVGGTGGAGNAKPGGPGAPFNQHPGGNVRDKGLGQVGGTGGAGNVKPGGGGQGTGGQASGGSQGDPKHPKPQNLPGSQAGGGQGTGGQASGGGQGGPKHPKPQNLPDSQAGGGQGTGGQASGGSQGGPKHPKPQNLPGSQAGGGQGTGGQASGGSQGGPKHPKPQNLPGSQAGGGQGTGGQASGGSQGGPKHPKPQNLPGSQAGGGQGTGGQASGGGQGGPKHPKPQNLPGSQAGGGQGTGGQASGGSQGDPKHPKPQNLPGSQAGGGQGTGGQASGGSQGDPKHPKPQNLPGSQAGGGQGTGGQASGGSQGGPKHPKPQNLPGSQAGGGKKPTPTPPTLH